MHGGTYDDDDRVCVRCRVRVVRVRVYDVDDGWRPNVATRGNAGDCVRMGPPVAGQRDPTIVDPRVWGSGIVAHGVRPVAGVRMDVGASRAAHPTGHVSHDVPVRARGATDYPRITPVPVGCAVRPTGFFLASRPSLRWTGLTHTPVRWTGLGAHIHAASARLRWDSPASPGLVLFQSARRRVKATRPRRQGRTLGK